MIDTHYHIFPRDCSRSFGTRFVFIGHRPFSAGGMRHLRIIIDVIKKFIIIKILSPFQNFKKFRIFNQYVL